jgi:hypothetical protein
MKGVAIGFTIDCVDALRQSHARWLGPVQAAQTRLCRSRLQRAGQAIYLWEAQRLQPRHGYLRRRVMQTELEFLDDINAVISQTLDDGQDPVQALKTLANEVRERIRQLDEIIAHE